MSCPYTPHRHGHGFVALAVPIQQTASAAEIIEPRMAFVGFGGRPVEAMVVHARVVAPRLSITAQHGIESGIASLEKRDVRSPAFIGGITSDASVSTGHLTPFIVRRQTPSRAELTACLSG